MEKQGGGEGWKKNRVFKHTIYEGGRFFKWCISLSDILVMIMIILLLNITCVMYSDVS